MLKKKSPANAETLSTANIGLEIADFGSLGAIKL